LLVGALSGCGLVSGLDGLEVVGDASLPDASLLDATSADAADATDASTQDASDADSSTLVDASGIACGPTQICPVGQTCCITSSGSQQQYTYSCGAADCAGSNTSASLSCDDRSDCNTGQICCLTNNVAQCVSSSTACATELCANAQQCSAGAKCAQFGAGFGLSLSRCQ
jgi:hypothetical protein